MAVEEKDTQQRIIQSIAQELHLKVSQVEATVALLDEGNTIPFIARYRKEATGKLDENQLRDIHEKLEYLRSLQQRREEVSRLISEVAELTPALQATIESARNLTELDDIYRPYRPKRKTRASIAKEKGLEPLANWILEENVSGWEDQARSHINAELGVETEEDALQGAKDIIAEYISDDAALRKQIREFTTQKGKLVSRAIQPGISTVYDQYYEYEEALSTVPAHRVLAMNRGEKEEILRVTIEVSDEVVHLIEKKYRKKPRSAVAAILQEVFADAYKRLIAPSIEREVRNALTEKAEEQAIRIFSFNLRNLLLQPPIRDKVVLGIDPAYRTGCKIAVVDETGKVLHITVTYPTPPQNKIAEAADCIRKLVHEYQVDVIAIGNGTGSRETEQFVADLIPSLSRNVVYIIVNEAGASVYSASKLAGEEFPKLDVAERSAISIARRLQDPLAELVKIDPKSVGVGQYQHDVSQKRLSESLGAVVESAVNSVGVDLNTASASLLSYVAGLSTSVAKNIVSFREEHGKYTDRKQLLKVPRLGPKAFEQCAGFLRVPDSKTIFDNTPIHPESYEIAERLLRMLGYQAADLHTDNEDPLKEKLISIADISYLAEQLEVGEPTLKDIVDALQKPGRDPREELPPPVFRTDVLKMEDLQAGMVLKGTVRNVVDFGAFVDIGVKQDGLVHISELSNQYVKHPMDVVAVGDIVDVQVISVDLHKGRISLSMKQIAQDTVSP
ncbi:Tex family protein [Fodinisporobacter ferrooxydans]